ncbi:MAG: MBL fold metallo-hydrolase, partial [Candidatus Bathyarchaeia archaeon]
EKTLEASIIDPGFEESEAERIFAKISENHLKIKYIVNTHGHMDHVSGNAKLKQVTGADILIHENDALMLSDPQKNFSKMLGLTVTSPSADRLLQDGDAIEVGQLKFEVIHTPGHSSGSISLYCKAEGVVFTGDTLFAGSIGRTDLLGSSFRDIMSSLKGKLMKLPDSTVVYPGHGEKTTIGKEKQTNPYLLV